MKSASVLTEHAEYVNTQTDVQQIRPPNILAECSAHPALTGDCSMSNQTTQLNTPLTAVPLCACTQDFPPTAHCPC